MPSDQRLHRHEPSKDLSSDLSAGDGPSIEESSSVTNSSQAGDSSSTAPLMSPPLISVQRIDRGIVVAPSSVSVSGHGLSQQAADKTPAVATPSKRSNRAYPDPIVQSLMLLVTMGVMLAAARYAVPGIVEEIRYSWHRGELRAEYETGTEGLRNVSLDALSDAYQMVTSAVGPSVVHIEVQRRPNIEKAEIARLLSMGPISDQGSGVIVDADGYLLTNRHVIADGEDITVTLSDGRRVSAVIVGTDSLTDLAVLKIDSDRLIPITWGDSDRCRVGSPVWAVGSPFGLDRTFTFGILSGKHRMVRASTQYQDFMQSDVAVNPGNSGGPLIDSRGTLVGINTAIVGDTYQGVSFSIPSNVARQVCDRLRETGHVERGWLGVAILEVPDDRLIGEDRRVRGALVRHVTDQQSPAAKAGLKSGDVILKVDNQPIRDTAHLMRMIAGTLSGTSVTLDVSRDDERIELLVQLGELPSELNLR